MEAIGGCDHKTHKRGKKGEGGWCVRKFAEEGTPGGKSGGWGGNDFDMKMKSLGERYLKGGGLGGFGGGGGGGGVLCGWSF